MKKQYFSPEMEIVEIKIQPLLAGSATMDLNETPEIESSGDILAPSFGDDVIDNIIFGF